MQHCATDKGARTPDPLRYVPSRHVTVSVERKALHIINSYEQAHTGYDTYRHVASWKRQVTDILLFRAKLTDDGNLLSASTFHSIIIFLGVIQIYISYFVNCLLILNYGRRNIDRVCSQIHIYL